MIILPAIDLHDGSCVRLLRGDYATAQKVAESPVKAASYFESEGARWLHMVDLDGAKFGHPVNDACIFDVLRQVNMKVELGGGIRLFPGDVFHDLRRGETRRVVLVRLGHPDVKIRDADAVQ